MAEKVDFAELEFNQKLGFGASGYVLQANWRDQEIAVKIYDILDQTHKQTAEREFAQLSKIDHENIVKVFGSVDDGEYAYVLMEYMDEGSLHKFLHGDDQREYTVKEALRWAQQCVAGLAYMHAMEPKPLLHRDIKPQNVLMNMLGHLKICDFGIATDLATYLSTIKGTPAYMAPEVIRGDPYSEKCDIYSFGITLWEMMSREVPFSHLETNDNVFAVLEAIKKGERPPLDAMRSDCWEGIRQLVVRCWDNDPARRPTAKQIEECLGSLGPEFNYEDFIQILGDDTMAVVTFHKDASGKRCYMRVDFWRKQGRTIRMAMPIVEREAVRLARVVAREVGVAAQDMGRETARAAHDGEREFRRAEKDGERETSRAAKDTEREVRRAEKDGERAVSKAAGDTGREATRVVRQMRKWRL